MKTLDEMIEKTQKAIDANRREEANIYAILCLAIALKELKGGF